MSPDLNVNVFPFILRGVSLLGVDSVEVPLRARTMAWQKLAGEWKIDLSSIVSEVSLEELNPKIDEIKLDDIDAIESMVSIADSQPIDDIVNWLAGFWLY